MMWITKICSNWVKSLLFENGQEVSRRFWYLSFLSIVVEFKKILEGICFHMYKIIINCFESNRNQRQLNSTNITSIYLTEFRKEADGMYFQGWNVFPVLLSIITCLKAPDFAVQCTWITDCILFPSLIRAFKEKAIFASTSLLVCLPMQFMVQEWPLTPTPLKHIFS